MNSGGIRGSFEIGDISYADMLTVMPFQNTINIVTVKGWVLRQVLEQAVGRVNPDGTNKQGGILQVSGLKKTLIFLAQNDLR